MFLHLPQLKRILLVSPTEVKVGPFGARFYHNLCIGILNANQGARSSRVIMQTKIQY